MKLFLREQHSLFGEILDWMLTPLLLLWPISLVLGWLVAQGIAGKPFDRMLEYNVNALAQLLTVQQRQVQLRQPLPEQELLRANDIDAVYYQVLGARGEYLGGERKLPAPPEEESNTAGVVKLRDDQYQGQEIRIAYMWVALPALQDGLALVQVAEALDKRSVLAAEIIKGVMLPQFATLPLAVLLVWLALVQAIKPLSRLEERIRARRPDDLSPLDTQAVPMELAPLVASVNDLLLRLKDSISVQKRFLADAAHQLKTPLAGLSMQADLAQHEGTNAEALKQSLRQISRASVRATHTVNQLLALARAESGTAVMSRLPCDLARLTMDVVRDCVPRAMDKFIDLGYEGAQPGAPGVMLPGNPTLLQELVLNLLNNAISYTPSNPSSPGVITARVLADPDRKQIELQVEDSGPGVAPAERELIFQSFYRALGNDVDGSGLGLSIAREIAHQHHASISVEDVRPGHAMPGARFCVRFDLETT